MVESYFRNARKENNVWTYPIPDCVEECREKFPRTVFQNEDLVQQLKYSIRLFVRYGEKILLLYFQQDGAIVQDTLNTLFWATNHIPSTILQFNAIISKCAEINNSSRILQNVINNVRRRVSKCLEENRSHVQHFL
ncbi:hypothetical protein BDFB_014088 [Asbolus verrucosus]|uniref:Uncharacterized protein n=1 Tax=Asbolus verrucosus TaxID=1661398 RepID=A0A482VY95_ASBVE|nr:hypothetical protein BDFB_014088 [Asbolus verrucosus]